MKFEYRSSELTGAKQCPEARAKPPRRPAANSGWGFKAVVLLLLVAAAALGGWWWRRRPAAAAAPIPLPSANAVVAHNADTSKVSVETAREYLTPSTGEMRQLFNYVLESPFVSRNPTYYQRVAELPFYYAATNDIVNAGARRLVAKNEQGEDVVAFDTEFCGGAARYARLVGLAFALQDAGRQDALKDFVKRMPRRLCAVCSEAEALAMVEQGGLVEALANPALRQRAISFSSGTIAYIIAHELGHHALGHMTGFYEKENLEVKRNQEREADSFASSVISSSAFGEYVFAGTLFWGYAQSVQSDNDSDAETNHPLWRERFENCVRANREKAAALGIEIK